jgi:hypothetical protein
MVSSSCSIVLARKSYLNYRLYQAVSNKQTVLTSTEKVYELCQIQDIEDLLAKLRFKGYRVQHY